MSSSIRLKIQLGNEDTRNQFQNAAPVLKFIYLIDSPSQKTVDDLRKNLQTYINEQYLNDNLEILELTTIDGFTFSKNDRCSDVFKDNDHILCIDMNTFAMAISSTIDFDNLWLQFEQHDASDDLEKSIHIGLNTFAKLFIRLWVNSNLFRIYLFNYFELIKIASEKRRDNQISRLEGKTSSEIDWFLEAKWEYDTVSNKDLFILCNIKVGSSDEIYSNKLHIQFDQNRKRIVKGEIIQLSAESNDLTDQQRQRLKDLIAKLPLPKHSGPEISTYTNDNVKISKYECEGESSIRMSAGNTNTVNVYQEHHSTDDNLVHQNFVITHIIFSKKPQVLPEILQQKRSAPADKPVSVASLTVMYQSQDGAWRECQDVAIAPMTVRNEQTKWLTDSIINIEPDKLISFTIKGCIQFKGDIGKNMSSRARSHKNLPQPLKLKIVITDNFSRQCYLIVEQLNKPLQLISRESFLKNHQSSINELLAFVTVDDCQTDERFAAVMYLNTDNELFIKNFDSRSQTFRRKALRTMEFNARQNKTTEMSFEFLEHKYYSNECKIIGLFDAEMYLFYAVRFELSTKTSKTEETHPIPIEKIQL